MPNRGGACPGAGRPRVTLTELVLERRFDVDNHRHRRLLDKETFEVEVDDSRRDKLLRPQASYARASGQGPRRNLAAQFGRAVQGFV
jgi:hypothetical protein